ncbi:MAG: hypothetical protein ACI8ZM_005766 [Crocinitomix sp.]|jgi:hypothetical protein
MINKHITAMVVVFITSLSLSQSVDFKDTSFQRAILNHDPIIDINGDQTIQQSEADSVKRLDLRGQNITSIHDAHNFPNIIELLAGNNNIVKVKLDSLLYLKTLIVGSSNIEELAVSNLPRLIDLYAGRNKITRFNVENCLKIDHLYLSTNNIESIDLVGLPNLTFLVIGSNKISELDVTNNPNLKQLYCRNMKIDEIDLRQNPLIDFDGSGFDSKTKLLMTSEQKKLKENSIGPPPPIRGN